MALVLELVVGPTLADVRLPSRSKRRTTRESCTAI